MQRTQIYLGRDMESVLARLARETGQTKSALIRAAVRKTYQGLEHADELAALERSAGAWRKRSVDGKDYVEGLRSGRLAALHKR